MKKILLAISMMGFIVSLFVAAPSVFAGATSLPLSYGWFSSSALPPSHFGKVIFNVPDGSSRMVITWILQNANPSTSYTVGFDTAFGTQSQFGQLAALFPGSYNVFVAGTITTDQYGAGSFHINVDNIAPGTYVIIFWIIPTSNLYNPVASTGNWDVPSTWTTVTF